MDSQIYFFKSSQWEIAAKNIQQLDISHDNYALWNIEKSNRIRKRLFKISLMPCLTMLIMPILFEFILQSGIRWIRWFFILYYVFCIYTIIPISIFHIIYINAKILHRIKYRILPESEYFNGVEYCADAEKLDMTISKQVAIPIFIISAILSFMIIGGSWFLQL